MVFKKLGVSDAPGRKEMSGESSGCWRSCLETSCPARHMDAGRPGPRGSQEPGRGGGRGHRTGALGHQSAHGEDTA